MWFVFDFFPLEMKEFSSVKCDIELQKMAQQVAHLEKVIADNLFQWECCARGGNKTAEGGCDVKAVESVSETLKELSWKDLVWWLWILFRKFWISRKQTEC